MIYLLDTNICVYLIKKKPIQVLDRFKAEAVGTISVSSITVAELFFGVAKSQFPDRNELALQQFLLPLTIAPFDTQAAQIYGQIRAELERTGRPIGAMDMLIAAHAKSLNLTLVTNNEREFVRIPNLRIENWTEITL